MRIGPRSLRGRLTAGLLVLLALICAAIGAATTVALDSFLLSRVDQQLTQIGKTFAISVEHGEGDTRGQSVGTLGVRVKGGRITGVALVSGGHSRGNDPGLTLADQAALIAVPTGGRPYTVELSSLDDYRVVASSGIDGDILITGLPLRAVEGARGRLEVIESVVFSVALVVTGLAAVLWVWLSLRPLRRVAATASRVSELPLASGEAVLPERVPYTDPRTEVGQVGAAFNRMLGHVESSLARRHTIEQRLRGFAADASHELRTPLAAVRGHAELARRHAGPMPGEVLYALERIEAESGRMAAIVDDLLLLARLDAGRPLAREEEVDLTRLAIDATGDARAAEPGHRWRLELPEEPVTVPGDPDRLHQVVAGLLANAGRHTPEGTTVTVAVETALTPLGRSLAVLTVTDDGPGIPADLQPEIFERFVRGDKGRSRGSGGTGLGLAIVRAVVGAHGGTVELRSTPGRTVFKVTLPAERSAP